MTDEEFKQKLSEVCEWKIPDTPRETSLNQKRKRRKSSDIDDVNEDDDNEEQEVEVNNSSYAPMIIKLKCLPVDCEDCGKVCENGRHIENKFHKTNRPHWRKRCVTCDKVENPETGKIDVSTAKSASVWADYLRKTNPRYYGKKENIVVEDDNCIITKNPEISSMK